MYVHFPRAPLYSSNLHGGYSSVSSFTDDLGFMPSLWPQQKDLWGNGKGHYYCFTFSSNLFISEGFNDNNKNTSAIWGVVCRTGTFQGKKVMTGKADCRILCEQLKLLR